MNIDKVLLTFLMLNLFGTPVFSNGSINPKDVDFRPIEAVSYTPVIHPVAVKDDSEYQQVMFYIPVYTMTVKQKKESTAVGGTKGAGVIMPVYNNINRSKSVVNPVSTPQTSVNPPVITPPDISNALPKPDVPSNGGNNSDIADNSGGGNSNGNGSINPPFPDGIPDIADKPQNPDISPVTPSPETAGKSASGNKSKNITAIAPIITGVPMATFKKGTKVKVKLCDELTSEDKLYKRLTFVTTEPIITTYSTIPIGTEIKGQIVKKKEPKNACECPVISVKARRMVFADEITPVDGVVTKAVEKKVFFNNIKGDRGYVKGVKTSAKHGKDYFDRMADKSAKFVKSPKTAILAPFPVIAGTAGMTAKMLAAPFTALKAKSEPIVIASGSEFEFKLKSDCNLPLK